MKKLRDGLYAIMKNNLKPRSIEKTESDDTYSIRFSAEFGEFCIIFHSPDEELMKALKGPKYKSTEISFCVMSCNSEGESEIFLEFQLNKDHTVEDLYDIFQEEIYQFMIP